MGEKEPPVIPAGAYIGTCAKCGRWWLLDDLDVESVCDDCAKQAET